MSIMVKKFGRLLLPEDELLEGRRVSSVVFAGEKKQFGPCEVRSGYFLVCSSNTSS